MSRRLNTLRCAMLLAVTGAAAAQGSFDVTMRIVEDTRGLNAAVIVIGPDVVETRAEPVVERDAPVPAQ
jgi:hypothetical protein